MKITINRIRQIAGCHRSEIVAEFRAEVGSQTYVQEYRTHYYMQPRRFDDPIEVSPFYLQNSFSYALEELAATVRQYAQENLFIGYLLGGDPRELFQITYCDHCKEPNIKKITSMQEAIGNCQISTSFFRS